MHTRLVVFLKERMLQSCRYTMIDTHKTVMTVMYVYYVQLTIPRRNVFGGRGTSPHPPMVGAYARMSTM